MAIRRTIARLFNPSRTRLVNDPASVTAFNAPMLQRRSIGLVPIFPDLIVRCHRGVCGLRGDEHQLLYGCVVAALALVNR